MLNAINVNRWNDSPTLRSDARWLRRCVFWILMVACVAGAQALPPSAGLRETYHCQKRELTRTYLAEGRAIREAYADALRCAAADHRAALKLCEPARRVALAEIREARLLAGECYRNDLLQSRKQHQLRIAELEAWYAAARRPTRYVVAPPVEAVTPIPYQTGSRRVTTRVTYSVVAPVQPASQVIYSNEAPVQFSTPAPYVDPAPAPYVDPASAPYVEPTPAPHIEPIPAPRAEPMPAPVLNPPVGDSRFIDSSYIDVPDTPTPAWNSGAAMRSGGAASAQGTRQTASGPGSLPIRNGERSDVRVVMRPIDVPPSASRQATRRDLVGLFVSHALRALAE